MYPIDKKGDAYTARLHRARMQISIATVGAIWHKGYARRLMRTIKAEEVDVSEYTKYADAVQHIGRFLNQVPCTSVCILPEALSLPPSSKANGQMSSHISMQTSPC